MTNAITLPAATADQPMTMGAQLWADVSAIDRATRGQRHGASGGVVPQYALRGYVTL